MRETGQGVKEVHVHRIRVTRFYVLYLFSCQLSNSIRMQSPTHIGTGNNQSSVSGALADRLAEWVPSIIQMP